MRDSNGESRLDLKQAFRTTLKYVGLLTLLSVFVIALLLVAVAYRNSSTANEKSIAFLFPSFYLEVEDQNGEPVENVSISYTNGHNYWLGSNSSYAETTTDPNGLVRFRLDGRQFDIDDLTGDGYHIDFQQQLDRLSDDPLQRLFPAFLRQYGRSSPLTIKAWKIGLVENAHRGAGSMYLEDGESVQLSLMQNHNVRCLSDTHFRCRRKLSLFGQPDEGRIVIELNKVGGQTAFNTSLGWSLSISVPSGGIVEVYDLYLYEAPVEGYSPEWTVSHRRETTGEFIPNFIGRTHKFYLSLNSGRHYGRLYVDVRPFYGDRSRIWLEYLVNADGGRNLDPSPRFHDNNGHPRYIDYEYLDPPGM